MKRPYVLNHMGMTLDGKANGKALSSSKHGMRLYMEKHKEFLKQGYTSIALGKTTSIQFFPQAQQDYSKYKDTQISLEDNIIKNDSQKYAIFFDRYASIGWAKGILETQFSGYNGAQIIVVLLEKAPKEKIAYYKDKGIAYIFAGKEEMSIMTALEKLKSQFGIEKILMEGGPILNGAFIKEDCIDEISLIIGSSVGDTNDKPLFQESVMSHFKVKSCMTYVEENSIWVNYGK